MFILFLVQILEAQKALSAKDSLVKELEQNISDLKIQVEDKITNVHSLQQKIQNFEDESFSNKQKFIDFQQQIVDLQDRNLNLETSLNAKNSEISTLSSQSNSTTVQLQQEVDSLQKQLVAKDNELTIIKEKLHSFESSSQEQTKSSSLLENELKQCQKDLQERDLQLEQLRTTSANTEDNLRKEIQSLEVNKKRFAFVYFCKDKFSTQSLELTDNVSTLTEYEVRDIEQRETIQKLTEELQGAIFILCLNFNRFFRCQENKRTNGNEWKF